MAFSVQSVCRKCGRAAKADEFVLDYVYKMMVCPACVKERKEKERDAARKAMEAQAKQQELKKKPADWDAEDEYLEKASKTKPAAHFERIDNARANYSCQKCRFKFVYNAATQTPRTCPYCGAPIRTIF